jgi:hypothetical protein
MIQRICTKLNTKQLLNDYAVAVGRIINCCGELLIFEETIIAEIL